MRRDRTAGAPAGVTARLRAAITVLCIGLSLASCTSFSNFVSDNWPTWAGGRPKDVPPRPGEPGYAEFIAHGKAAEAPPPDAGTAPAATPVAATAAAPPRAAAAASANAPALPPGNPQPNDSGAVHGGLY